ncbi:MAG: hypothetical protein CL693_15240 [Cellvibrionaceae bacterium]|nr:hypothetical protein [Cellvibrionaceae bacterium]|tara:strand:- start:8159 stop:8647 length:489 start_codon:yes stop_codon:yes gene_type:complete
MESALQTIEQMAPDVVPSLMLPLAGRTLLVPTVTVAEMVPFAQAEKVEDAPDWLLGDFYWRDLRVPLLSFEVLNGEALPEVQPKSRVAVFNNTGVDEGLPFIAISTQGIPKLVRVGNEDIAVDDEGQNHAFDRLHVTLNGEAMTIPDITALEHVYLEWRNSQ